MKKRSGQEAAARVGQAGIYIRLGWHKSLARTAGSAAAHTWPPSRPPSSYAAFVLTFCPASAQLGLSISRLQRVVYTRAHMRQSGARNFFHTHTHAYSTDGAIFGRVLRRGLMRDAPPPPGISHEVSGGGRMRFLENSQVTIRRFERYVYGFRHWRDAARMDDERGIPLAFGRADIVMRKYNLFFKNNAFFKNVAVAQPKKRVANGFLYT